MLRTATEKDARTLARLEAEWSGEPWSEEAFRAFLTSPASYAFLWEKDGDAVGYLTYRQAAGYGEVVNLAVKAAHRRCGIARALMEKALSLSAENVTLEVRRSNAAARALYETLGFVPCGERRAFYTNPKEDALVYSFTRKDTLS